MTALYFNARQWRRLGLGPQEIKLLEELVTVAGGTSSSSTSLDAVTADVAAVQTSVATVQTSVSEVQDDVDDVEDEVEAQAIDSGLLMAELKRLQFRVSQLEDEI